MSGAIPFTFFQALRSNPDKGHGDQAFPFASLVGEEYWEGPHGHYRGWAPGMPVPDSKPKARPTWYSDNLPPGFEKWKDQTTAARENQTTLSYYSSRDDPLRITNLDYDLLQPLSRALKDHKVSINHVVLILMESARKDIFPLKAGSHLHEEILSSYNTHEPEVLQKVNEKLSNLTPIAEKLTGESGGFVKSQNNSRSQDTGWEDTTAPGMGGINFDGVLTGSTLSFKSAIMNYCGMGPLPVDFMDEVKEIHYQPCIMQIFDLFNQLKENATAKDPNLLRLHGGLEYIHDRNWTSVFLQSM
jgi:hypothetical protein